MIWCLLARFGLFCAKWLSARFNSAWRQFYLASRPSRLAIYPASQPCLLEEFVFILVLILTLVSIRLGHRIGLASKIPFYLVSYLSIRHPKNYGVKTRKFPGRGKHQHPVSSTKRYFKPRSIWLLYGTICIFVHHRWKQKHVSVSISISRDDGNWNMFLFPQIQQSWPYKPQ